VITEARLVVDTLAATDPDDESVGTRIVQVRARQEAPV
jgi:hypothetical protein